MRVLRSSRVVAFFLIVLFFCIPYTHGAGERREQSGVHQAAKAPLNKDQAIAIASKDAEGFGADLRLYEIRVIQDKRVWHIDFELKNKGANGGPLHYRISKATGKTLWKQYEQ